MAKLGKKLVTKLEATGTKLKLYVN